MEERIFTCIVCEKQGIDKRNYGTIYCSYECYKVGQRLRRHILNKGPRVCTFNNGVTCDGSRCADCGWNPKVESRRKEALAKCKSLQSCPV